MLTILLSFLKIWLCLYKVTLNYFTLIIFMYQCYLFINITPVSSFLVFLLYNDEYFEYLQPYKKDENQRTIFENHGRQIGLTKANSYYSVKHQKKKRFVIPNAKQY